MAVDCDVLIIGSGPSGTSAAFPLLEAGLKVVMADGGKKPSQPPPVEPSLESSLYDTEQWKWKVGRNFYALRNMVSATPKLRIPPHSYVFEDFEKVNKIHAENFIAVGSLAPGGLSNAWGCGVARLSHEDLKSFPFPASALDESYDKIAQRVGLSGKMEDDLSSFFGVDAWADPALPLESLHTHILRNYLKKKNSFAGKGFKLGRSRVAVLGQDKDSRQACTSLGNCLWGCAKKAQYSSIYDLPKLKLFPHFQYESGFIVEDIVPCSQGLRIHGLLDGQAKCITASKVLLAAGVLASTRFALKSLGLRKKLPILTCPTAAFLLWIPRLLGTSCVSTFGFGQLSYAVELGNGISGYGSTYCTTGIPLSEFIRYMPFARRYGARLLRGLLSSCLAGSVFLPGTFSESTVQLQDDGSLFISGAFSTQCALYLRAAEAKLRRAYLACGAVLVPTSFTPGMPGGDIHCSGTFPMRELPELGNTTPWGEVFGLDGVYIVDGACLPELSEKPHLLTLMANADRIAKHIVTRHV